MHTLRRIRILLIALAPALVPAPTRADYSDCRTCHYATSPDGTAPDLTSHFIDPGHHPVRVSYPADPYYNQPGGTQSGILFFDRNGNGSADADEIQIFSSTLTTSSTTGTRSKGSKGNSKNTTTLESWVIDCASCHIEHGTTAPDPAHPADYVRGAGGERLQCTTCHRL